jgi:hypothetical protein
MMLKEQLTKVFHRIISPTLLLSKINPSNDIDIWPKEIVSTNLTEDGNSHTPMLTRYPTILRTYDPEQEIWNMIRQFEIEYFVRNFTKERIANNTNNTHISLLKQNKLTNNQIKGNSQLEILEPLRYVTASIASEIANSARQGYEFYTASKQIPLLSRPILTHYSFEKLSNVLISTNFDVNGLPTFSHGVSYKNGNIRSEKNGLFQRFHDCYSFDPSIYAKKCSFKLENIVDSGPITESELYNLVASGSLSNNRIKDEISQNTITLHELDREFLFIFGISVLARYEVNEWNEILSGKYSDKVIKIQRYLQTVQLLFPNLIVNYLLDKTFIVPEVF